MNIAMIGSGYVGLVSGACFSEFGASVTCIDVDASKIARLDEGRIPIYEPGLDELVARNVGQGRLRFTTGFEEAVSEAELIFIAVGTPSRRGDGHADLSFVYDAARRIAPFLRGYSVIVDKSTVPVGTARQVARIVAELNPEADFDVASNPEFLREGAAIGDFMRPDRIVIGVESDRAEARLRALYRPLNLIEVPIVVTDLETAELVKYARQRLPRDEDQLHQRDGGAVRGAGRGRARRGARHGARRAHRTQVPAPGAPGTEAPASPRTPSPWCAPRRSADSPSRIVESVVEVNAAQRARMVAKIRGALGGDEAGKVIAVLGLTFKPDTDDMRDAPALAILPPLVERGARVRATDPRASRRRRPCCPTPSSTSRTPTRPSTAPTRSCSSRSGTCTGVST